MQLVYQTNDMTRAHEIVEVLEKAGIETSMHGIHSWSIEGTSITVWVTDDDDLTRANQVLEQFYASEAPQRQLPAFRPETNAVGVLLLVGAIALCVALGIAIYGS